MLLVSLIPLLLMGYVMLEASKREIILISHQNLKSVARLESVRLEQLILDTQRMALTLSRNQTVIALFTKESLRPSASAVDNAILELKNLVDTNPTIASAFIINREGIGIASTSAKNIGQDLTFREYFQQAVIGKNFISEILVGKTSSQPGLYFSVPIFKQTTIVGVMVLKLKGETIWDVIDSTDIAQGGYAMLLNRYGVVLAHPDKSKLYHSLGALSPETLALINPKLLWSIDQIHSLGLSDLQKAFQSFTSSGNVTYTTPSATPNNFKEWIAGYASVTGRDWIVTVSQPTEQFMNAVNRFVLFQAGILVLIAIIVILIAFWRIRDILVPIRNLTQASQALAQGDFSVRAIPFDDDEIGTLSKQFNEMIPKIEEHLAMRESLRMAEYVQLSMLPEANPIIPGLDVAGFSRYCDETGGDYFDFINLPLKKLAEPPQEFLGPLGGESSVARFSGGAQISDQAKLFCIGDVMGHGIAAALLMVSARSALHAIAQNETNTGNILTRMNYALAHDTRHRRFMTTLLMRLEGESVYWANAGHESILIFDPKENSCTELIGDSGIPAGILSSFTYEENKFTGLKRGMLLFLGTDGVWEMENVSGEQYGKVRLREFILQHHEQSAQLLAQQLDETLMHYRGTRSAQDDVTFIIIKIT